MISHTVYYGHVDNLSAEIADGMFRAEFGQYATYLTSDIGAYEPVFFDTLTEAVAEAKFLAEFYSAQAIGV